MLSGLMGSLEIFCADIGSEAKGRFGWATTRDLSVEGTSLQTLAEAIAGSLNNGRPVAPGFECPLFVPIARDPVDLTRAGWRGRAWSAGAGAGALATGLAQAVWLLRAVRAQVHVSAPATTDWGRFSREGGLLVWEAFVTGKAKAGSHAADARAAVEAFGRSMPAPTRANAIRTDEVHSLIGACCAYGTVSGDSSVADPFGSLKARSLRQIRGVSELEFSRSSQVPLSQE